VLKSVLLPRASAPSTFLALGCVGLIAAGTPAFAQSAETPAEEAADPARDPAEGPRLGGMTVTDTAIDDAEIKVDEVESPKATAPILDTPQTITVISDQTLRKQNLLTLRDALSTVPGITFTAGEGGGGYGDRINLRGFAADNDITQDGVRDSAQYSRTDPFNLQQIEVYNGANSVFNGSGSVGGTINLVSKVPQPGDLTILSAGIGTDDYYRGTVDTNLRLTDTIAVRLNAMIHRNDVPGRDVERFERYGIAPSVTFGIEGPTRLTLMYFHQRDDNTPVFGVPYYRNAFNDGPLSEANDSDYFGIRNLDDQDISVDQLTAIAEHDFSDDLTIRNLTRWQRVDQDSITSAPQGVYCLSTGVQPTGAACPAGQDTPGFYYPAGPRGLQRQQESQLFYNQTDLRLVARGNGLESVFNLGASFTFEDYSLLTAQNLRNPGGALPNPAQPPILISDPDTVFTGPINRILTGISEGDTSNKAIYLFNTTSIGEMFELNGGIRYEWNRGTFSADTVGTPATGGVVTRGDDQRSREDFLSYRVGAVFKPAENISLYAAYGNSQTPSSATVRLGCGVGTASFCDAAPEKAENYEIGGKAELFDRQLLLTAAIFRNERTNFRVASNDPTIPDPQVLDGRSRVDGIALGASGNITPEWSIFANYTYLDGEILQAVSDFCLGNPGATGCGNSAALPDPQRGDFIVQAPKHSGSLFTTYRLPFGLELGYGLTYQGSFALNNTSLTAPVQIRSDDYFTHRAFLSYAFENGLTAQLNVQNLTDEDYYTGVRNNGWATPGEARSAVLSLFYSF
jgi:catecholate siderophore receptor